MHIYRSRKKEGKKHKCQSVEKNWFMSFVCIRAGFKTAYDVVNVMDKDNTVKTIRTCCRYIKHQPFTKCKWEFELPNAQMQKFHHWAEFNNSSVFKCLDNGHCDCTLLQFKSSTIHHWTMFATKTTRIGECVLMLVGLCATVSDDEWWTGEGGCILFTLLHVAARIFTLLQYVCQLQTTQTLTHCRGQAE